MSSKDGYTDVVKLLLDHGADVHAYGDEALIWTSERGHNDVIKLLLDHGADPSVLPQSGLKTNESLRDYLKPKSEEEIQKHIGALSQEQKNIRLTSMTMPKTDSTLGYLI